MYFLDPATERPKTNDISGAMNIPNVQVEKEPGLLGEWGILGME